jgi:hypothetical protein
LATLCDVAFGGQFQRMATAEDRLDDLWGEEAETHHPAEVGPADPRLFSEFGHCLSLSRQQHLAIAMRLAPPGGSSPSGTGSQTMTEAKARFRLSVCFVDESVKPFMDFIETHLYDKEKAIWFADTATMLRVNFFEGNDFSYAREDAIASGNYPLLAYDLLYLKRLFEHPPMQKPVQAAIETEAISSSLISSTRLRRPSRRPAHLPGFLPPNDMAAHPTLTRDRRARAARRAGRSGQRSGHRP